MIVPVTVAWLSQAPPILEYKFSGYVTLDDLELCYKQEQQLLRENPEKGLSSLMDVRQLKSIPRNAFPFIRQWQTTGPRSVKVVIVGTSPFLKMLIELVMRTIRYQGTPAIFADTRDEALEILGL